MAAASMALAACGSDDDSGAPPPESDASSSDSAAPASDAVETASVGVEDSWPDMEWADVVAEADGQSLNWYLWGGSAKINSFTSGFLADQMKERYNVNLNIVQVGDTADAVNTVLGEVEAGKDTGGSVDMIWINGENFKTLRQADLLFGPYSADLPNNISWVDTDNPYFSVDFGYEIDGYESLLGRGQMVIEYNSDELSEPPRTIDDFVTWACDNPGKVTYPAPPDFHGTGFLTPLFYHYTGGADQWQGAWDEEKQALFEEKAPTFYDAMNDLEPCLWRGGETYPADTAQLDELMNNGEIWMAMNYGPTHAATKAAEGAYPTSVRTYVWDTGTVANASYVAIPKNASNKAPALLLADMLLDPEMQLEKLKPDNWGMIPAIDLSRLDADLQAEFAAVDMGEQTLLVSELSPSLSPMTSEMIAEFETGWRENVLQK